MVMLFEGYGHGLRLCVCSLGFYWAIKIKDEKVALRKTANVVICYKHTNIDTSRLLDNSRVYLPFDNYL